MKIKYTNANKPICNRWEINRIIDDKYKPKDLEILIAFTWINVHKIIDIKINKLIKKAFILFLYSHSIVASETLV